MATNSLGTRPRDSSGGANYRAVGAWTLLATIVTVIFAVLIGGFYWFEGQVRATQLTGAGKATTSMTATEHGAMTAGAVSTAAGPAVEISRSALSVPEPITRTAPTTVHVDLKTVELEGNLDPVNGTTYTYWTFDGTVPGPMLRVMQGDTVVIHIANATGSSFAHSIDLHAVTGPGGGSGATQTLSGKDSTFSFKALNPGLYIYHCATAPVSAHIVNGMYGMILVEPPGGLPRVDREYYVMQGEMYTTSPFGAKGHTGYADAKVMAEQPDYYVFNGRVGSLTAGTALHASVGDRVRIFFGVGTFKSSAFHVIGAIFDTVYPDGGIGGPVERNVGLVNVPAGGATIVEIQFNVPGTYVIVDHALQRVREGASGQIVVDGPANPGIFDGAGQMPSH